MKNSQAAFTLIELMVTIAVLAVVVGIAVPSFTALIETNRVKALAEDLGSSINAARMEALKRGNRVSVCASTNGTTCGGQWADGWIMVVDGATSDSAASPVITTPSKDILRVQKKIGSGARIDVTNGKTFLRFTSTGMLARTDSNPIGITISSLNCKSNHAKKIDINLAGMVSVSSAACSQGGTP